MLLQVSSVRGARSLLMWGGWGGGALLGPVWANDWVVEGGGACQLKDRYAVEGTGKNLLTSTEACRFPNHPTSFPVISSLYLKQPQQFLHTLL